MVTLAGKISYVRTFMADSGWCVLEIDSGGDGFFDIDTAVGVHPGTPRVGDEVELNGEWQKHPKYGRQFKFSQLRVPLPSTPEGRAKYLDESVPEIGPARARAIADYFGERVFERLDADPSAASSVPGIGPVVVSQIAKHWPRARQHRELLSFLMGCGISTGHARRVSNELGEGAVRVLREDPYRLSDIVPGFSFKRADQVALGMGIGRDSHVRVRAGIQHVLQEAAFRDGHCCLPRGDTATKAGELLELSPSLIDSTRLSGIVSDAASGVELDHDRCWLSRLLGDEKALAEKLCQRAEHGRNDTVDTSATYSSGMGFELTEEQQAAVREVLSSGTVILTGGPGTGKTTTVRAMLQHFQQRGLSVDLAAPTGRAAKRLSEVTGHPAGTVHRLLEYDPTIGGFRRDRSNPLGADVVIVDEFSMVDLWLAARLLDAVHRDTRLVIVGDSDQLPSVGPGSVLRDVLAANVLPSVKLTQIQRQAEGSPIIRNAHRVNRGQPVELTPAGEGMWVITGSDLSKLTDELTDLVTDATRLGSNLGLDPKTDVQVLAPQRNSVSEALRRSATPALNTRLQQALNPDGEVLATLRDSEFRVGDRVLHTRNNYTKGVFNGEIGVVSGGHPAMGEKPSLVEVLYDDERIVEYEGRDELSELDLAYAMTVHKSQGCEYPCVVLLLHSDFYSGLLKRNLLYTAMTRASKFLIIFSDRESLARVPLRSGGDGRITMLAERLRCSC